MLCRPQAHGQILRCALDSSSSDRIGRTRCCDPPCIEPHYECIHLDPSLLTPCQETPAVKPMIEVESGPEPPRFSRRLQSLRGSEHEHIEEVVPGGSGTLLYAPRVASAMEWCQCRHRAQSPHSYRQLCYLRPQRGRCQPHDSRGSDAARRQCVHSAASGNRKRLYSWGRRRGAGECHGAPHCRR